MAYEARGKVAAFLEAMRATPNRIWQNAEVAKVMDIRTANVHAYLEAAVRHGALHRATSNGSTQYALIPFTATGHVAPPASAAPPAWTPKPMVPPRDGSEIPRFIQQDVAHAPAAPAPTPAPAVQSWPAPAPRAEVDPEPAPEPEEDPVDFDACVWLDGSLTIWGAQENEDGSITIQPDQLTAIRRRIAWGPV